MQTVETTMSIQNRTNTALPAVYHCKICGFISTRRKEYTYTKGVMLCVECKEEYESGV